jgi:hypothetical protein
MEKTMSDKTIPRKPLNMKDLYERSDEVTRRLLNLAYASTPVPGDILQDEYLRALNGHVSLMADVRAELNHLHDRILDYTTRDVVPIKPPAE